MGGGIEETARRMGEREGAAGPHLRRCLAAAAAAGEKRRTRRRRRRRRAAAARRSHPALSPSPLGAGRRREEAKREGGRERKSNVFFAQVKRKLTYIFTGLD